MNARSEGTMRNSLLASVLGLGLFLGGCVHQVEQQYPDPRPDQLEAMYAAVQYPCGDRAWRSCAVTAFAQFRMPNFGENGREGLAGEIAAAAFEDDDDHTIPNAVWVGHLKDDVKRASGGVVTVDDAEPYEFGAVPKCPAIFLALEHKDGRRFLFMITASKDLVIYGWGKNRWMLKTLNP